MSKSTEIHDMIQTFAIAGHPELVTSRLLDILDAMNRRMDEIEAGSKGPQNMQVTIPTQKYDRET